MSTDLRFSVGEFDAIPAEIRGKTRWLNYRLVDDAKHPDKPKKVPIQSRAPGHNASVDKPETWAMFSEAVRALRTYHVELAGIGFVFTADDDIAGVDLDGCRDPSTGVIAEWALAIIAELSSYTEISQSGTGVHIIVRGKVPGVGHKRAVRDERGEVCGHIEMYDKGRYFIFTGQHLGWTPSQVEERSDALHRVHARHLAPVELTNVKRALPSMGGRLPCAFTSSDEALLEKARAARNGDRFAALYDRGDYSGYGSHSEADLALCSRLAFWTDGDATRIDALFRASALFRPKWTEKHGAVTYGQITIAKALAGGSIGRNSDWIPSKTEWRNAQLDRLLERHLPVSVAGGK